MKLRTAMNAIIDTRYTVLFFDKDCNFVDEIEVDYLNRNSVERGRMFEELDRRNRLPHEVKFISTNHVTHMMEVSVHYK